MLRDNPMRFGFKSMSRQLILIAVMPLLLFTMVSAMAQQISSAGIANAYQLRNFATQGYTTEVEDLRVKVLGGYVRVARTYKGNTWHLNGRWNPLQEIYAETGTTSSQQCSIDGCAAAINPASNDQSNTLSKPSALNRNGYQYEQVTEDLYQFGKNKQIRIIDNGYRWEDSEGNWIEYGPDRKVMRYGGRNEAAYIRLAYTEQGYISGVFDALEQQVLWFETNPQGLITEVRDRSNRQVEYHYPTNITPPGDISADPFWLPPLTGVTDVRGYTWQYQYDGSNRLHKMIDPESRTEQIDYNESGSVKSVIKYAAGQTIEQGIGEYYQYSFDEAREEYYVQQRNSGGRITETWYNLDSEIIRQDINSVTFFTAKDDNGGRRRTITNYNELKTVYDYDDKDNLLKIKHSDNTTESWTYNEYSDVLTHTNENGITTKNEYDERGNLIKTIEALGKPAEQITEYQYDQYGNQMQIKQVGDANTAETITIYEYDTKGNVKKITDPGEHITEYTHDSQGNVLMRKDGRGHTWTYTYDHAGNILSEKNPLNHITTLEYDKVSNLIKITNAVNDFYTMDYDARNRLIKRTDPYKYDMLFTYNAQDQVIKTVDEQGKDTNIEYDLLGRRIKYTDPVGNITRFEYAQNNAGLFQISKIIYPTFVEEYHYDNRGRLLKFSKITANDRLDSHFVYDAVGNLIQYATPDEAEWFRRYDARNRLISNINPDDTHTEFVYDDRDNLISFINENGILLRRYQYDRNNRLMTEIWPESRSRVYEYDENGNFTALQYPDGKITRHRYDIANRLIGSDYYESTNDAEPQKTTSYTLNAVGNLIAYDDGQTQTSYTRDKMQRVLTETVNYGPFSLSHTYTYTANGQKSQSNLSG